VSLRNRILLVVLFVIAVVSVLNVRLVSNDYRERYQVLMVDRASLAAQELTSRINRLLGLGLYLHEFSGFDKQLDKMVHDNPELRQVAIVDRNDRILYQSQVPGWPPAVSDLVALVNVTEAPAGVMTRTYRLGPENQEAVGYIVVVLNAEMIEEQIEAFSLDMLRNILLAAVLGLGLLYLLLRHFLGRPTQELLSSIRDARLETSYHPAQDLIERRDEIGLVARTFDSLIGRLTESNSQLALQRNRAQAADRAKTQFLANISHELLTPLNGIGGMAYLLSRSKLDDAQLGKVQTIMRSSDHLRNIVTDILDYSSIDSGAMQLEQRAFRLDRLLANNLKGQLELAREKGITLDIIVDERIPHDLLGDPERLAQLLQNLVNNAIKFNPKGSRATLTVGLVKADEGGVTIDFSVEDDGIGMPAELVERLFAPFEQADNSNTREHGGTGLGLVISQHIVSLMGGTIAVTSQPGQGSRFFFSVIFSRPQ
jgi:signal transduction histidine kinase